MDGHQVAGADDRHAVAEALDLRQHVRAEEDGPALAPQVVEDPVERVLHERIETLGRLVQDRELGVVLQRLDDADLLAHPA